MKVSLWTAIAMALLALTLTQLAGAPARTGDPAERVIVSSETGRPREVPFTPELTLLKAIIAAGGFGDFGGKPVFLIRRGKVSRVDLRAIIEGRARDVSLQPWDIIALGKAISSQ